MRMGCGPGRFSNFQTEFYSGCTRFSGGGGGGGGGELAYVVIRGCAIILGTFLGVVPGFLGIILWLFPDFWVSFFW